MKKLLIFILAVIMAVSVSGCGKNTDPNALVANNAGEVEGYNLAIYTSKPDTLCPILSKNESNINMLDIVYDSLVRLNDKLTAEPCLAESWSVSADGKVWTFNLRRDVLWHDGSGFGANDVVYTVNQIKNSEDSIYRYHVSNISDISAEGQHTLKVSLSDPWPGFVNLLYFPIIKNGGEINRDAFKPVGTGSYKFEDRNEGTAYYLVRNDNWWGGKALTGTINVKILPDNETALHSFNSGVVDITMADVDNRSRYVNSAAATYTLLNSNEFTFLGINSSDGALQFAEVRKAISKVVDREKIVNDGLLGYGTAATVPFHPEWELCGGKTFATAQNIDGAKAVLKDNGWTAQSGYYTKVVEETAYSTDFRILYNEDNALREYIAQEVKKNLESVGIRASLEKVPYEDYTTRIAEGDYDIFVGSYILSPDLELSFMVGGGNIFGFSDEKMTGAINKARMKDPADMKSAYSGVISAFEELNPVVGICFTDKILVHSNKLQGELYSSCFDVYRGIEAVQKGVAEE